MRNLKLYATNGKEIPLENLKSGDVIKHCLNKQNSLQLKTDIKCGEKLVRHYRMEKCLA